MISRDGSNVSLWQEMPPYETSINHNLLESFNVAIIGGGITGLSTALMLQRQGCSCIVMEAQNIGYGTTGGTTAHLNTLLDTPYSNLIKNFGLEGAKKVYESVAEAIEIIKTNISDLSINCEFESVPAYLFSQDEKQSEELDEIVNAGNKVGLEIALTNELPFPLPFVKVACATHQGKFHPIKYIYGLAKEFERLGGTILQECRVHEREDGHGKYILSTDCGKYAVDSVVYATHTPPGINPLHLRTTAWRSYALAATLRDGNYPRELAYDMEDPYHYYRCHEVNGVSYLIAGGKDHQTGHEPNSESCFLKLEAHIRKYFDLKEVVHHWSSQYYESVDGLPYIGHFPGAGEKVYVATGFGGNGMTYSTVAAKVISDLIVKRESKYHDLFSPARFKPVAGFKNFVAHNVDVLKEFTVQWFSHEKLQEFAGLAPGEGIVVDYNKTKIAVSKDSNGNLRAVNPVCPHMGCSVSWNLAEQSWDCPCHGARYAPDGKVLNGPSDKSLELIELKVLEEVK